MALIRCPECGKEISDRASACIHCGFPLDNLETQLPSETLNEATANEAQKAEEIEKGTTTQETGNVFDSSGSDAAPCLNTEDHAMPRFYQKTWFVVLMLLLFFPVGTFLMWKYKKFNKLGRIIASIVLSVPFLFWVLIIVALLIPCEHEWEDATCTKSKVCQICGEAEGEALGHDGDWSEWEIDYDKGKNVRELVCTRCETILDSEMTEITPFVKNGCFTFSARSFIKLFEEADKEASDYNYTYMRVNGEDELYYEIADIEGGYEKVKSVGMVGFEKGGDTPLSIEEDFTENLITKINVLIEDIDDVPSVLVSCLCATDPTLNFASAYNVGLDVMEEAGDERGYTHNGINYVVAMADRYYFIVISIEQVPFAEESNGENTDTKEAVDNTVAEEGSGENTAIKENEDDISSDDVSKLTVSSTNVSLNNSSQSIAITVPDSYNGEVYCTVANSDILSTSWGGWSGNTVTLTLIPNATGSTSLEIYLENGDSVTVNASVSVTDYSPNAADYTTLRIAPATYYTFNDDEGYFSDIVLLESADYKVSDNGDGTVNITISGTMQRKTNNISPYIQIGYSLYVDGEDIKNGTVGTDAPVLNQSYGYTLEFCGLQPGNYIIYFTSY